MLEKGTMATMDNYQEFLLQNKTLTIIFNPYQVAPHVVGRLEVNIPMSRLFSLVKDSSINPSDLQKKSELIMIENIEPGDLVTSPMEITGKARGTWFFEGSFPVVLVDVNNDVIAQGLAESDGVWMTEEFVQFTASLDYIEPKEDAGYLILKKDNPSDLREYDDQLVIGLRFK